MKVVTGQGFAEKVPCASIGLSYPGDVKPIQLKVPSTPLASTFEKFTVHWLSPAVNCGGAPGVPRRPVTMDRASPANPDEDLTEPG